MTRKLLAASLLAFSLTSLGQTTPANDEPKPVAGLKFSLDRADHATLDVTFQNVDKKPLILNLGDMLGNGLDLWPNQLHFSVTTPDGKARDLRWKILPVGGTVDRYLVPLPPGAKYSLSLPLSDLSDLTAKDGKASIAPGEKVRALYEGAALRIDDNIALLHTWTDKIESVPLVYDAKQNP